MEASLGVQSERDPGQPLAVPLGFSDAGVPFQFFWPRNAFVQLSIHTLYMLGAESAGFPGLPSQKHSAHALLHDFWPPGKVDGAGG
jgi:hypothetical protein